MPTFDSRAVCYPSIENIRDYMSWRQADCHINNLYNTTFWCLVDSGKTETEAEDILKKTLSADKNEILFSQFGVNYNNLPGIYRKGTLLYRTKVSREEISKSGKPVVRERPDVGIMHDDFIQDTFWNEHPDLLQ